MRLQITFELENNILPVQYRKSITSFIKNAFIQYDENFYNKFYKNKDPIQKPYTYGVFLDNPQFEKEKITLKSNIISITFSIYDYLNGIDIYNAFNKQRNVKFSLNQNSMKIININLQNEQQITEDKIIVKLLSPMIIRNHNKDTGKDYYYSYEREGFLDYLKINILESLKAFNLSIDLLKDFEISPIQCKKTVVPVYEQKIEATLGMLELKGDKQLLDFLYKTGIGTRRSLGFGLFEILNKERR